jgi:hypothetical protein
LKVAVTVLGVVKVIVVGLLEVEEQEFPEQVQLEKT